VDVRDFRECLITQIRISGEAFDILVGMNRKFAETELLKKITS
jgi:hypothetical protein